jgi:hypothetical protein
VTEVWTPKERILLEQQVVTRPIVRRHRWHFVVGGFLAGYAFGFWLAFALFLTGCVDDGEIEMLDASVDVLVGAMAAEPELPLACVVDEPGACDEVPQTGGVGEDRPGKQQQPE